MTGLNTQVTDAMSFYGDTNPFELLQQYGSPLYVYNENIFRQRCRELKNLVSYKNFTVNFSVKANSNLSLIKIAKEEGLSADAMSPGEIYVELMAGFDPSKLLFISNNVSKDEMMFAIEKNILISVDSLTQLEQYGQLNNGGKVAIRFNPGVGAGHHEKVVTGGKKTKFGVAIDDIPKVKEILNTYNLTLVGINQHIGSLFMDGSKYVEGAKSILDVARNFNDLDFIDLGGGFGIPYEKQAGQQRLDLVSLGKQLDKFFSDFAKEYGKEVLFKIEPGRYLTAECGVVLGEVYSIKENFGITYAGCDLGFNVLQRPMMYDSHHDIEVYRNEDVDLSTITFKPQTIVGNICESGDIMAKGRDLPVIKMGDIIGMLDAGAYGYSMASNYNNRLRPAEVMITTNGDSKLIRKRDTLEDIVRGFDI